MGKRSRTSQQPSLLISELTQRTESEETQSDDRLYGEPQHESWSDADETLYGEPQHELDVDDEEWAIALARLALREKRLRAGLRPDGTKRR
ncbi:hypothetical protein ACNS7O_06495 [Haloferacaceae archaeon DSL9]